MYKLLILSKEKESSWENFEILKRKDFSIKYERDFQKGFEILIRENFDLFVAEEKPHDFSFKNFCASILNQLKVPNIKGILICSTTKIEPIGPFKEVLYMPLNCERFNFAIAKALNLKTRASTRYIVRMHLGLIGENVKNFKTCVTLNISSEGMLVESTKPLPIGKVFLWTFQGIKDLEGFTIKGQILNKADEERYRYGVKFIIENQDLKKKIEDFLKENA